jgi:hypothetical protein
LRRSSRWAAASPLLTLVIVSAACGSDPELRPDQRLQDELGLSPREEVHRITITGGQREEALPTEVMLEADAYVEFVTMDSWVHEVYFELDSLDAEARSFIEDSDQASSPPMVSPDSRFVISMHDAPPGRYPFRIEGNGAATRGVVIVAGQRR